MVTAITELGEDAIIHILRFVGTLQDLKQMGFTSTQFRSLVFASPIVDQIFRTIHPETDSYQRSRIGGRQYWKNMYQIRQSLEDVKSCNDQANPLQTAGILSAQEELESLCYDNPNYRLSRPSVGYFGFQPLEGSPVAVWGDFHGLAIVPSLDALTGGSGKTVVSEQQLTATRSSFSASPSTATPISSTSAATTTTTTTSKICSDAFQIMAVVYQRSKLFLGNASGLVQSVLVRKDETSGSYDFPVLSSTAQHDNEVTSLACAGNHLASACVDGYVILHLDALDHGRVDQACIRLVDSQRLLFSMASITTSHGKTILCMGGEERILEALFWDANHFQNPEHRIDKVTSEGHYTGDRQLFRNRRLGHLTNLKFLGWRHPRLVAGTR
jgi:hypothetical protein